MTLLPVVLVSSNTIPIRITAIQVSITPRLVCSTRGSVTLGSGRGLRYSPVALEAFLRCQVQQLHRTSCNFGSGETSFIHKVGLGAGRRGFTRDLAGISLGRWSRKECKLTSGECLPARSGPWGCRVPHGLDGVLTLFTAQQRKGALALDIKSQVSKHLSNMSSSLPFCLLQTFETVGIMLFSFTKPSFDPHHTIVMAHKWSVKAQKWTQTWGNGLHNLSSAPVFNFCCTFYGWPHMWGWKEVYQSFWVKKSHQKTDFHGSQ